MRTEPHRRDMRAVNGELQRAISECPLTDRRRLRQKLDSLRSRSGTADELSALKSAIEAAQARVHARRASVPTLEYPEELPVSARREEIAQVIASNQVIVLCGETGSGKTTQLPKICLGLGRGIYGAIGHTQPRRLAARTVADRIAEEIKTETGALIGYKVRFSERTSDSTLVKLMTDGILLSEMERDRLLLGYDTLIIDEAHERSLNIDFLLGYLKQLLPKRPDLKLIITSATIDPQSFSQHFNQAPVIEVSGRNYPVELRYRPYEGDDDDTREDALIGSILSAVDELVREGPGDILVFLPGEREIREGAEALRKHHPKGVEVLPLYARLSSAEQHRVFESHAQRRIVLATNVAETSLTVPGVRYVIDSGLARISRYSARSKVLQLPIEPISQASAQQRSGRCGRTGPGIAVRLYAEDDYEKRPQYTDPEIRRANLAAVILTMRHLRLGEVEDFPFLDPPERRFINDAYQLLAELGAVNDKRELTPLGRRLAVLPVDPRLGRMILQAVEEGALHEVLIIASALAANDPRERPIEARQAADEAHKKFADAESDFMAYLKLWAIIESEGNSGSKLRKLCKARFLSWVRVREWQDIYRQLRGHAVEQRLKENDKPADYAVIHRALLSGLLGQIAARDEEGQYRAARGRILSVHPGSGLFAKPPRWIMAAELAETTKLYARTVGRIDPMWAERIGAHLLSREYLEPHWEPDAGQVAAFERVSLYGLVLVPRRRVNYGPIDPKTSREIFIREALVQDGLKSELPALVHNRKLIAEVESLEDRSRRRDILVDEEELFRYYDARLPADCYSAATFLAWMKAEIRKDPKTLLFSREQLMRHEAGGITGSRYPDRLTAGGLSLPLSYRFEPGAEDDGVTVAVPKAALNQLELSVIEWLVPGLIEEKIEALLRSLPKNLRRHFAPASQFARALNERIAYGKGALAEALTPALLAMSGIEVPVCAWTEERIPPHLRMRIVVFDEQGNRITHDRDLTALKDRVFGAAPKTAAAPAATDSAHTGFPRAGLTEWDFEPLPERVEVRQGATHYFAYPAIVDEGEGVALRLLDAPTKAAQASRLGVRRLFMLALKEATRDFRKDISKNARLGLIYREFGSPEDLAKSFVETAFERAFISGTPLPKTRQEFTARLSERRAVLAAEVARLRQDLIDTLDRYQAVKPKLARIRTRVPDAHADIADQLAHLVYADFLKTTPADRLPHLPRYLQAIERRLDKLEQVPDKDSKPRSEVAPFWADAKKRLASLKFGETAGDTLIGYRWLIEEFRVSLFAQPLKTAEPVSAKRLSDLRASLGR